MELLDRCRRLKKPITFISRLRLDAALYKPAPPRYPGQIGRPRLKGERLPNLSVVAEDSSTIWKTIMVANWYGKQKRTLEIVSKTAVWYSTGLPAVPLRWVLIRDPKEEFQPQALLCTDLSAEPEQIILWFVRRWQMEATFQEVRQRLGFETRRHWSEMAIQRTAPPCWRLFSAGYAVRSPAHDKSRAPEAARQTAWYGRGIRLSPMLWPWCARSYGRKKMRFLRVGAGGRDGKSPAGVHRATNRRGLLRSVNGQSPVKKLSEKGF